MIKEKLGKVKAKDDMPTLMAECQHIIISLKEEMDDNEKTKFNKYLEYLIKCNNSEEYKEMLLDNLKETLKESFGKYEELKNKQEGDKKDAE